MWDTDGYEVSVRFGVDLYIISQRENSKGEAFKTGNFTHQMRMMDAMLTALEKALVGFT